MDVRELGLPGLLEITPRIFEDERGFFFESYNRDAFVKAGLDMVFVQDNQSFSQKGVVRGLHFQHKPWGQGKLARVLVGRALDVVVDIRRSSPTFGQHFTLELDAKRQNMIWVPEGFAHGFTALEDTVFHYKCTNTYHKNSESGILWNDPSLGIDWQVDHPIVSAKDEQLGLLAHLVTSF
jgi:dTDP-4-dehydrorhamnose 3,5-epimerase